MAYDLEQQEQLDAIKAWWKTYGTRLVALVVIVIVAVSAFVGWRSWQTRQAEQASVIYDELTEAVKTRDMVKVEQTTTRLNDDFGRTAYASMAAMQLARLKVDASDLQAAKMQYDAAIDHARAPEIAALARLRKAAVLIDLKEWDEAIKTLSTEPPEAFVALYADRRGDVYRAQDKLDDARREYRVAIDKLQPRDAGLRNLIQVKLDSLGEG
ncbi:tetratricopeptide repeat protein [soil metagenome]